MPAVVADLHVHTTRSDGTVSPSRLASVAATAGLEAVAITDHDRLPPFDAPFRQSAGTTVIAGIELRVAANAVGRVDLLGLGVRHTEALASATARLQRERIERARRMVTRLEAALDVTLEVDLDDGVGRPHLARAVADTTDLDYQEVFERYIGEDGPCYEPRSVPTFDRGRRLLADAAAVVVLAHPLRYDDPMLALELVAELDGYEAVYPYDEGVDRRPLSRLTDAGLLTTGGSDAHSADAIGRCGLGREEFAPVARAIGLPMD